MQTKHWTSLYTQDIYPLTFARNNAPAKLLLVWWIKYNDYWFQHNLVNIVFKMSKILIEFFFK